MAKNQEVNSLRAALDYADSILSGQKPACHSLIQVCQRFLRDLKDTRYEFRAEKADFVVYLIEKTFVHVKGELAGQPFLLEPWEKFICCNLAGFYLAGTEERRFKEAFIFIPRKNGKTPLAAALGWAFSLLDSPQTATLYIIANKLDRARESFDIILENLREMGEWDRFQIRDNNSEHSIQRVFRDERGKRLGALKIQALASDAKRADGLNANLILLDEIHAYKSANEYHVYKQAMKAYVNKLLIGITTAGRDMNSFCYSRLTYCQKIAAGELEDESYFVFLCQADQPEDYTNPLEHEKANPNYGVTIRPQEIMASALQAQNDPASRNEFLNKELNVYTDAANAYFNMAELQDSDESHGWTWEELAQLPIVWYGGADLSVQFDLTAGALYGEYQGVSVVIAHGFMPIAQAQRKATEDNIPFFWWQEQGWLTFCNGEVVDHEELVKWFITWRKRGMQIRSVAFDKYKSRDFVRSMERAGFKMEYSDQQYWKKSEAFREIERKAKERKLYYLHNKAFAYCVSNVKAVEDAEERVRFSKVAPQRRIDLFDAAVIACKQRLIEQDKNKRWREWF